jgi:hypothetical protein
LKSPKIKERTAKRLMKMSPKRRKALFDQNPRLAHAIQGVFASLANIADSCEKTTRCQWESFNQLARKKKMSSAQLCDALDTLIKADIEKNGNLWTTIQLALGGAVIVVLGYFFKESRLSISKASK